MPTTGIYGSSLFPGFINLASGIGNGAEIPAIHRTTLPDVAIFPITPPLMPILPNTGGTPYPGTPAAPFTPALPTPLAAPPSPAGHAGFVEIHSLAQLDLLFHGQGILG